MLLSTDEQYHKALRQLVMYIPHTVFLRRLCQCTKAGHFGLEPQRQLDSIADFSISLPGIQKLEIGKQLYHWLIEDDDVSTAGDSDSGETVDQRVCRVCGDKLFPVGDFCGSCGALNPNQDTVSIGLNCIACGHKMRPGARFCNKCGHRQDS